MKIRNIRTFIPSKDFQISRQFYLDLGFEITWEGEDLVIFGTKEDNFFLQKFYVEDWANNCMMQLHVEDLESLYNVAKPLIEKYEGTKIKPIFEADYGKTFHIIDPAGVLWHMTEVSAAIVKEENKLLCEDE